MHLSSERVEGAEIALAIGVDIDRTVNDVEEPRLRVVRTGGQRGCANRSTDSFPIFAAPQLPWCVRRTSGTGEYTSVPRSISKCGKRNGGAAGNDCLWALHGNSHHYSLECHHASSAVTRDATAA
jgi:hypothetical protein